MLKRQLATSLVRRLIGDLLTTSVKPFRDLWDLSAIVNVFGRKAIASQSQAMCDRGLSEWGDCSHEDWELKFCLWVVSSCKISVHITLTNNAYEGIGSIWKKKQKESVESRNPLQNQPDWSYWKGFETNKKHITICMKAIRSLKISNW